jgi:5-hydroxyisourate hydrolase-like protein (transthyretin family)
VLRVTVTSNGAPVAATSVALMFLPSTSTAWRRVGTAITDANGRLVWTTPAATVTGSWRAYVADTWARRAGTAIAAPTVAVKASTAVVLTAPARVAAGTAVRAVTRVSSLGAPVAGVRVYYRWRPAASATWVLLGTNLTNAKGIAVRTYTPRTSGFWKATVAATSTRAGFATVKTVPTVLVPVVTATSKALSVKVGGVATIRATTRPVGAGQAVVVQRRSGATWVAVGVATTDAKGRMATRVPSTRKGTATYRFVVRATANHAAAASASIVVTVV